MTNPDLPHFVKINYYILVFKFKVINIQTLSLKSTSILRKNKNLKIIINKFQSLTKQNLTDF